jgi:2-polyprenyl-6-methoxyphenol hydroxylase-like FAD-dependent oxidoreductase
MAAEFDVLIVGGGVGGAALALALAHAHPVRVLVIERRPGPGNINRGDSLLPAVTRHLKVWGALDRFMAAGANPVSKMQVFHHRGGLLLEAPLLGPDGSPYLVLPHPEIERNLADAARATGRVEFRFKTSLRTLLQSDGRVRGARIVDGNGVEETIAARLVVGADGSNSAVREHLEVPFLSVPYDTGYYIIELARPAAYEDAMRLDLHPQGAVMTMPQTRTTVGAAVLVHPDQRSIFQSGTTEAKLAAISERAPILQGMAAVPKGAHLYKLHRGHATRYVARGAALIGDAVHVTNPTAGQGMTMAIEDGAALAEKLAPLLAVNAADADLDRGLAEYESLRRPANGELVRWSHWMGRLFSEGGELGDEIRRRLFAFGMTSIGKAIHRTVWNRVATRKAS